MKTTKILTCGASVLFAAVLGLQAQSSSPSQQRPSTTSPSGSSSSGSSSLTSPSSSDDWRKQQEKDKSKSQKDADRERSSSSSVTSPSSTTSSTTPSSSSSTSPSSSSSSSATIGATGSTSTTTGTQASTTSSTTLGAQSDVEVKTVVQQIDAQGPVVVERISTRFADVACSEENARKIVEALHNGGSVTVTGEDGKTATFNVPAKLGYGDAYVAMALAAEALREAGISGCATPEQWQAVLVGGELKGGTVTSSTTTRTERFPGVLVLHQQHGGWTQVAQTTNVQLGTIVAGAQSSLNIDAPTSDLPPRSGFGDEADKKNPNASARGQEKGQMKGWDSEKNKDNDKSKNPSDNSSYTPRSSTPGASTSPDTDDPSGKREEDKKGQPDQPPRGY